MKSMGMNKQSWSNEIRKEAMEIGIGVTGGPSAFGTQNSLIKM